jgi:NADPH-dependent F420 reductase
MGQTIAFVGGTGPQGRGLATRFALAGHHVVIGSRQAERGVAAAASVAAAVPEHREALEGMTNEEAVAAAGLVVVTVPYAGHRPTLEALAPALAGKIVVDVVVPVRFDGGPHLIDVEAGSATEEAAAALPASKVVGAFHNLPANVLLDPAAAVDADVLVTGADNEAKQTVCALAEQIEGVRAIDAGPLHFSHFVEGLTVLLIGINGRYEAQTAPRISGLPQANA